MRIRHLLPTASSRATVEGDRAFFMRNQAGDFLSLFTTPQTRYAGWFAQSGDRFTKVLERVAVLDAEGNELAVQAITRTDQAVTWEYEDGLRATWRLAASVRGLTLSLSRPAALRLILDMRDMYGSPELGRQYALRQEKETALVTYRDGLFAGPAYLHLRCKGTIQPAPEPWFRQDYSRDASRNSPPTSLYVYDLGTVTTSQLSLGFGWDEQAAVAASLVASRLKVKEPNLGINRTHDTLLSHTAVARLSVTQALGWLQTDRGMYAGLPWFHQVWSRDELIAALGLEPSEQLSIIRRYAALQPLEGELPTFVGSGTTCADGLGWLCLLMEEYGLDALEETDRSQLTHLLLRAHSQLKRHRQAAHGLIMSGHNATWMDTIGREGYRIEIQAMFSLLLSQLFRLTGDASYHQEYVSFLGKTRQLLFKGGYLHDGLNDPAKRPNVFLAYLVQPELLSLANWISCFDAVLGAISTPWGGLSSLDSQDSRFQATTTGQDNRSYHNGDSWFFVNSLAALAMHRLDARRYGSRVVALLQSTTDEILWEHMVGMPGEISSANHLDSFGCGIQAFSGGAYLALVKELDDYPAMQDRDAASFFWEESDATAPSTLAA